MHRARTGYGAGRDNIVKWCTHDGCRYVPPDDHSTAAQEAAFRAHRIDMGEHPVPLKKHLSATVAEDVEAQFREIAEGAGMTPHRLLSQLVVYFVQNMSPGGRLHGGLAAAAGALLEDPKEGPAAPAPD